jgi:hypothetical protein
MKETDAISSSFTGLEKEIGITATSPQQYMRTIMIFIEKIFIIQ